MKIGNVDDHVAELLSGYLDRELTQQQQQWVEVHIDDSSVRTAHNIGWLLLLGAVLVISGIAAVEFISDSSSS